MEEDRIDGEKFLFSLWVTVSRVLIETNHVLVTLNLVMSRALCRTGLTGLAVTLNVAEVKVIVGEKLLNSQSAVVPLALYWMMFGRATLSPVMFLAKCLSGLIGLLVMPNAVVVCRAVGEK